ncbi:LysM peptidoglycan-binding domain-containing protein [Stigmatella sp. ncwal1]|uniref:LysM peptidoglycan-binding domain-containing protein n=1 Tax=Stigmatella ashevillensis TaxID=2995309 RepID=A0ABT5DEH1_9BACT|nr:LysM peptidoglycan-binding domain-containing protein [Stigmatella ashevillena]MDC0712080.1 LysM peptidoglycan-binding domain-containing protein [Stigmatella ashevillena]
MDSIEYRVQSGDTLSSIARRHKVTEAVLSRLNGISDVNRIWAGQVLRIPKERPRPAAQAPVHKVCAGETLSGIAQHYQVTVEALAQANGISDPNHIALGRVLTIPSTGGAGQAAPRPASTQARSPATAAAHTKAKDTGSPGGVRPTVDHSAGVPAKTVPPEVLRLLEKREGKIEDHQQVYIDTEEHATAGMGHKLTASERSRYRENDRVPLSVLEDWARADVQGAYDAAVAQATRAKVGNQTLVNALACVNFQLGTAWYTEHKKTWACIVAHKWEEAAAEAADSLWHKQTPVRVKDFQAALRAMGGHSQPPVHGAGHAASGPDLKEIAHHVRDALNRVFTDEETVYLQLAKLNHDPVLIGRFKTLYKTTYRVDVVEDIKARFSNTWLFGNELGRALSYLGESSQQPSKPKPKSPPPVANPIPGTGSMKGAHTATLKKLGERARKRLNRTNDGNCAVGVSEMLSEVGYLYAGARPTVSAGIIDKAFDYSANQWISSTEDCVWVSRHDYLNAEGRLKEGKPVKTADVSACAKFMAHTLRLLKFVDCTELLRGNGWKKAAPEASVKALHALPEGAVVIFGPALSRSLQRSGRSYVRGGHRHAGHIGIVVHKDKEVLLVADGLIDSAGQKYTAEFCLQSYEWAIGFVPTTEPLKLTAKDLPSQSL